MGDDYCDSAAQRRQRISGACQACSRAKKACDEERPCTRCMRLEIACVDQHGNVAIAKQGRSNSRSGSASYDSAKDEWGPKRRQISRGSACVACSAAKTACDVYRPCAHCLRKGIRCEQWVTSGSRPGGDSAMAPKKGTRSSARSSGARKTYVNSPVITPESSRSPSPAPPTPGRGGRPASRKRGPPLGNSASGSENNRTPTNHKRPLAKDGEEGFLDPRVVRNLSFDANYIDSPSPISSPPAPRGQGRGRGGGRGAAGRGVGPRSPQSPKALAAKVLDAATGGNSLLRPLPSLSSLLPGIANTQGDMGAIAALLELSGQPPLTLPPPLHAPPQPGGLGLVGFLPVPPKGGKVAVGGSSSGS